MTPDDHTAERAEADRDELDELIEKLDAAWPSFPEQAIRDARARRDAMVPRLIEELQHRVAAARRGKPIDGEIAFFALFLLAEFEAREALPAILEGLAVPEPALNTLFGDAITTIVDRMLATLAGDRLEIIDGMIRNQELDPYVRWAAAGAYFHLFRAGRITRNEAVERLRGHLRWAINQNDEFAGELISELTDYSPAEALPEIELAFERDLVDPMLTDRAFVDESLQDRHQWIRREFESKSPTKIDTLEELKTWAWSPPEDEWDDDFSDADGFDEPEDVAVADLPPPHWLDVPPERVTAPIRSERPRVGRNEPCPCGSGRKYKKCCGRNT